MTDIVEQKSDQQMVARVPRKSAALNDHLEGGGEERSRDPAVRSRLAAALPAATRMAWASDYPTRPITIIVAFAPGGPTDTIARILAERLRAPLRQSVIIENVSGAGGSIGVARAVHAEPDGYTLSIGHWGTHVAIRKAIGPRLRR